jgi:hypothetical protein
MITANFAAKCMGSSPSQILSPILPSPTQGNHSDRDDNG